MCTRRIRWVRVRARSPRCAWRHGCESGHSRALVDSSGSCSCVLYDLVQSARQEFQEFPRRLFLRNIDITQTRDAAWKARLNTDADGTDVKDSLLSDCWRPDPSHWEEMSGTGLKSARRRGDAFIFAEIVSQSIVVSLFIC